ncbi:hypothetical protein CUJ88_09710 [Paraburkholderia hospita]|jgi:hypothetical protein|nr:hypothetical protein CUJ88_09710 [Paraburkholderia hospita]
MEKQQGRCFDERGPRLQNGSVSRVLLWHLRDALAQARGDLPRGLYRSVVDHHHVDAFTKVQASISS